MVPTLPMHVTRNVILMALSCASNGMFRGFGDRGNVTPVAGDVTATVAGSVRVTVGAVPSPGAQAS